MATAVMTQAPRIVVLRPLADRTLSAPGTTAAILGTVVVADKGAIGAPLYVTRDSAQAVFGKPMPMSKGTNAEGLRQLDDALAECQHGWVVRAISASARFPSLTFPNSGTPIKASHAYGTDIALASSQWLVVYPKDGHPSTNRRVTIYDVDAADGRFTLLLEEKSGSEWVKLEIFKQLGAKEDDVDDMGLPAYAPTVLESMSAYINCAISPNTSFTTLAAASTNGVLANGVVFEGGTNGSDPTVNEIKAAWDILKQSERTFNLAFAAGQYDPDVIRHADEICDELLVQFRFDAPPYMTEAQVSEWIKALNLPNSYQASCFHYPYKATDKFYGGKSVWGVSGEATAAKARGYATSTGHADVPGVHFAAAGETRGFISRVGIEPLHNTGKMSAEDKAEVKDGARVIGRWNPVDQGKVIGDALTMYGRNNYLRFEHVVAIHNRIMGDCLIAARFAKFEPDGLTKEILMRLCNEVCQKYVESGALVTPRDIEADGLDPFRVVITQQEIDLWKITIEFCPTGVFRRGALRIPIRGYETII